MRRIKIALILIMVTLACQSCGPKLSVYKIQEKPEDYSAQQVVNDYYDEEAKLGYTVLKDDNYLYVNISTRETAPQLKLLKNGIVVFLDKAGKKNETTFLQYPLPSDYQPTSNIKMMSNGKTPLLKKKIEGLKDDILYVNGQHKEYINRLINNNGISAEIKLVEEELFYQIKFPISYLASANSTLPNLGIAIKGLQIKSPQRNQSAQAAKSGGRGNGMRGGMGGGRGGGSRGGSTKGTSVPRTRSSDQTQDMGSNVDIWFKVDLDQ